MKYLVNKSVLMYKPYRLTILLTGVICVLFIGQAVAQLSGGDFEIIETTIQTGGGTSSDSEYELTGTIAQPNANVQKSTVNEYTLSGGFWKQKPIAIFSNGFENN